MFNRFLVMWEKPLKLLASRASWHLKELIPIAAIVIGSTKKANLEAVKVGFTGKIAKRASFFFYPLFHL
jgi:hypothetical protein